MCPSTRKKTYAKQSAHAFPPPLNRITSFCWVACSVDSGRTPSTDIRFAVGCWVGILQFVKKVRRFLYRACFYFATEKGRRDGIYMYRAGGKGTQAPTA